MIALFFISALVMLCIGVPVAHTIGLSSIIYILAKGIPPMIIAQRLFTGVDVAALMAIPFFILAGDLMNFGGIGRRLTNFANLFVRNIMGGVGMVAILACMFFAAVSGSGVATAAAIGGIMVPAMVDFKYKRDFAGAIIASASPIGVVIPPSISYVIYGVLTSTSITDLYLAGIPAGVYMGIALMVTTYFMAKARKVEKENIRLSGKEVYTSFFSALWALGTPVIIVGGVFGGIFTPTESAVVAVVYALFVGLFIYKEIKFNEILRIFMNSAKTTSKVMFIIANASLFAWVLAFEQIPQNLANGMLSISSNPIMIMLMINVFLLIAGCFMETSAILIITVPLFMPIINQLGISPVHFGIIVTVNTAIGLLTPPFGVCLFTSAMVAKETLANITKQVMWLLVALIAVLMLITYFPQLIMFLV